MTLRINDEYLDFNEDVYVETRSKLFEEIDSTMGDFSYSFDLARTSHNLRILGNPFPDVSNKTIYRQVECDLIDNSGIVLHRGYLRVDRITNYISCSFFSGNYNWISLLTGSIRDADFSDYDTELSETEIMNSMVNTEGLTFPLIDSGVLIERQFPSLKVEDFTACFYVKTIFKKVFQNIGIKYTGELINDPIFNSIITCSNNYDKEQVNSRSSFVLKTVPEFGPGASRIEFEDDFTFPYFDGSQGNYSTASHRYNADVKMRVRVDVTLKFTTANLYDTFYIRKNGVNFIGVGFDATLGQVSAAREMDIDAGEYIDILGPLLGFGESVDPGSTFKVTPIFIYKVFGNSVVPQMSKSDFVKNILSIFNVISEYEPYTKTVTFNFVDKIKDKEAIDLSEFVTVREIDYSTLASAFAKRNILKYQDSEDVDLRLYNINEFVKYGQGEIVVDNDFLEPQKVIVDSSFKSPISYKSPVFGASMERVGFVELDQDKSTNFQTVTDVSGAAQFDIDEDIMTNVGLVRIEDSSVEAYNGDWVIYSGAGSTSIQLLGCAYQGTATGKISLMKFEYSDSSDVFLFIHVPFRPISEFTPVNFISLEENYKTDMGYAFFNLLSVGLQVNQDYKQSLSFGGINDPISYQRTIIDTYWKTLKPVLDDPVKIIADVYLPNKIFRSLTPLRPIIIKTVETSNVYYQNRTRGYVDSSRPCELEIIKVG